MRQWIVRGVRRLDLELDSICRALVIGAAISFAAWSPALLLRGFLLEALLSHLAACLAAGVVAAVDDACSSRERSRRFACACLLAGGLPGLGPLGVMLALGPIWSRSELGEVVAAPAPLRGGDGVESSLNGAHRSRRKHEPTGSSAAQLELLLSLRNLPPRAAVRALRRALSAPLEEVRLLAHALLERREAQLRVAIADAESKLREARDGSRRFQLQCQLAFLHWGLVESELVPREIALETLARASDHARRALAQQEDGELCVLLARIRLRRGDGQHAREWLKRAAHVGVADDVLAPLLAEAAFCLRFSRNSYRTEPNT
jgi:hypothetical protein